MPDIYLPNCELIDIEGVIYFPAQAWGEKDTLHWRLTWNAILLFHQKLAVIVKIYPKLDKDDDSINPRAGSYLVCPSGTGVCSFPTANVSFWNDEGTLQEFLGPGQAYSVKLTLEVPESPRNRNLGMFLVAVNMFDISGVVSYTAERSTMLRYNSIITRVIDLIGWLPLYFFGFKENKQFISVLMFPHLVDNYYHPSVGATVEIRSHEVEIYSCILTLSAKFSGLKYYLYYWPITSAMFAFWSNLIAFAVALGVTMYKRSSDVKALAVILDLAGANKTNGKREKDEHKEKAKGDPEIESDEEETSALTTSISGTQTNPDTNEKDMDDADANSDSFDIPLVQEPVDFFNGGEEDEMGIDFVTELRQRRIN
ncbi:seipin [Plakobranchus ocellatus]|uniref:Seipin n=1 Tax=Plakobranchus ocellatus TaxID=259542 RepID=A0AAV3XSH7_9GAST|nr:seipin [Plakobranchus ocellatus]